MTERIINSTSAPSGIATQVDNHTRVNWMIADGLNTLFTLPVEGGESIDVDYLSESGRTNVVTVGSTLAFGKFGLTLDVPTLTIPGPNHSVNVSTDLGTPENMPTVDIVNTLNYVNILPTVDSSNNLRHRLVRLQDSKINPPADFRYLPTSNFRITNELIGFTSDFVQPIDFESLVTPLSPVDTGSSTPWGRPTPTDSTQIIRWGYSLNAFIVSGGTNTIYPVDPDAVDPPDPEPELPEVIRVVNIINMVSLPDRTPIEFSNLTIATDLDSIAWVVNFDVHTDAARALVRPTVTSVKKIEVTINTEVFVFFVGRTSLGTAVQQDGAVARVTRCVGWSNSKLLTYPYAARRSRTESSSATPAGILNNELIGTGFTATWSSPSWTLPANVFSYSDKAPLAAIIELAESVGGVIIPHMSAESFEVQPYYTISPWNWNAGNATKVVTESRFFTIDTNWIPAESPDSIFVYGEDSGVAVKAVRAGTAGVKTLPTVVDKHITDTIAGTERGRIEVARNGFKEIVPATTYLDEDGIIMPKTIMSVTEGTGDDAVTWFGMVIGVSIGINRNGNAITQALQIERHYFG